jgi:hypothetical protein
VSRHTLYHVRLAGTEAVGDSAPRQVLVGLPIVRNGIRVCDNRERKYRIERKGASFIGAVCGIALPITERQIHT